MHIPDGFINPKIAAGFGFAAVGALSFCISKVKAAITEKVPVAQKALLVTIENKVVAVTTGLRTALTKNGEQKLIRIGMAAAIIFMMQMFDFSIGRGSGHLMGSMFAAAWLGPFAGILAMSAVIIVQALFLADGGIATLGLNIFNLAIVGVSSAYIIYSPLTKLFRFKYGRWLAILIGAWSSVMLSALFFSLESSIIPAVLSIHAIVGLAEGLITIILLKIILKTLPQLN